VHGKGKEKTFFFVFGNGKGEDFLTFVRMPEDADVRRNGSGCAVALRKLNVCAIMNWSSLSSNDRWDCALSELLWLIDSARTSE
jgi:hypothetical protein